MGRPKYDPWVSGLGNHPAEELQPILKGHGLLQKALLTYPTLVSPMI